MTRPSAHARLATPAPAFMRAAGAAGPRLKVLIVDGYSNHDWQLTTSLITGILEQTGLFTIDVATAPPTADAPGWDQWRPAFASYAAIIQTCNATSAAAPPGRDPCATSSRPSCATAAASMSGTEATTPFPSGPRTTT